jgi:hypothetical protein
MSVGIDEPRAVGFDSWGSRPLHRGLKWPCRTNANGPPIALDPLSTREASITPFLTPIARRRMAAYAVETPGRTARARFARPFLRPRSDAHLLPKWIAKVDVSGRACGPLRSSRFAFMAMHGRQRPDLRG